MKVDLYRALKLVASNKDPALAALIFRVLEDGLGMSHADAGDYLADVIRQHRLKIAYPALAQLAVEGCRAEEPQPLVRLIARRVVRFT